jgi:hypothetical protein
MHRNSPCPGFCFRVAYLYCRTRSLGNTFVHARSQYSRSVSSNFALKGTSRSTPYLAPLNPQHRAVAVDVADLQATQFAAPESGCIHRQQHRSMKQVPGTVHQPGHFLLAKDDWQSLEALGIGQILFHISALQHLDIEEAKRGNLDDNCTVRQLPVFEQINLMAAKIVRSEMIDRFPTCWRNASTACR